MRVTLARKATGFHDLLFECSTKAHIVSRKNPNRMGLRLEGHSIARESSDEMITEGVSLGAIQITASGLPIILFVEQQTTGGYPKIANVISRTCTAWTTRPRDEIRFEQVSWDAARTLLIEQEQLLASDGLIGDETHRPKLRHGRAAASHRRRHAGIADAFLYVGKRRLRGPRRRLANHAGHIEQALRWKLAVGAHPGYPDRATFGALN